MNFLALIGIVDSIQNTKGSDTSTIKIKVEKPFITGNEDWYDILDVKVDKVIFKTEVNTITTGTIVGIKGRLSQVKQNALQSINIVCERLQVF